MALRFLQVNTNHCARAQDLLYQSLAEWSVHVGVVSEPYFIPPRDNWIGDQSGGVAIVLQASEAVPSVDRVERGVAFVGALLGGMMIIAVYFSPNRSIADFETFLAQLDALIGQVHPHPVLVAGDFNAKSSAWGSPTTDARGEVLEEWAVAAGLIVLNQGTVRTCDHRVAL